MPRSASTRRRFLAALLAFSGLSAAGAIAPLFSPVAAMAAAAGNRSARGTLAKVARHLYPHDDLSDAVYLDVVDGVLDAASANTAVSEALDALLELLDQRHDGDWVTANRDEQLASLRGAEAEPYFTAARIQVLMRLYNHPGAWELIGYDGPSLQHGGWVNRGFDTIDWLSGDVT